jgi:hypothetical protein
MAMPRRMDRAQRMRARRVWWDRNGSFVRGAIFGAAITAMALALVWRLMLV